MRLAWFSPLNPQPSGIADYSEELLPALSRHADIHLYIDPAWHPNNPAITEHFTIKSYLPDRFNAADYDQIVYHMGNDLSNHRFIYEAMKRFPGVVVLHDLVLMGFYAAKEDAGRQFSAFVDFLKAFYPDRADWIAARCSDRYPFPIWEGELAMQLPMNEEVCHCATALITHSRFVLDRLNLPADKRARVIPHHGHSLRPVDRQEIRRALGLSDHELLLISTGYVTRNKRYDLILDILKELGCSDLRYLIVGSDPGGILQTLLPDRHRNVLMRGFAKLTDLEDWIASADIGINLRNPTMGESSGSLMRMLSAARPVLISDIGSYREIPDHCAFKIDTDIDERETIKAALNALANDADFRHSLGREAGIYARETCGIDHCASQYIDFLSSLPKPAKEVS